MYRALLVALAAALVAVLVGAGFVGGFLVAKSQAGLPIPATSLTGEAPGGVGAASRQGEPKQSFTDLVREVRGLLIDNYVEPPDPKKIERGAIDGMIGALDDPYTTYFDTQHYRFFKEQASGKFYGVGIQIGVRDKQLTVIAPIEGTPAHKAGIKAGDAIVSIDGTSTKGMNAEIAASKIRGEQGTTVVLTVKRKGVAGTRDYKLTRVELSLPLVTGRMVKGTKIGYIRVMSFAQTVVTDVRAQLTKLDKAGARAYVIDVRDNPGGLLQSGVDMASLFVDSGPLIIIKQRGGKTETLMASGGADTKHPVIVLVNNGSASAAEIFAGALQDRKRAKLVGEQTFGKAAVQTILALSGGGGLKVTSAYYLTPSGHNISKKGIKPDDVVKFAPAPKGGEHDSQLAKAIELLKAEIR